MNDYEPEFDSGRQAEATRRESASYGEDEPFCEELAFSLTVDEAYICLQNAGIFKTSGKRAALYTVLMAIAAVGFFISYVFGQNYNWLIFSVICLLVIAAIWIVPYVQIKRLAKENAKGNIIRAKVREDMIEITGEHSTWEIPLDKTSRLSLKGNLMIFHTENGQLFAIPERAVSEGKLTKIRSIVKNGTLPFEK